MKHTLPLPLLVVSILCLARLATFASPETFSVSITNAAKVAIQSPDRWQHTVDQPAADGSITATVTAPDKVAVAVKITVSTVTNSASFDRRLIIVERNVSRSLESIAAQSVEKKVVLRHLTSKFGPGSYAVITDASLVGKVPLPEGKFLNLTHGNLIGDKHVVIFSIFSNETDSEQYRQALQIISDGLSIP